MIADDNKTIMMVAENDYSFMVRSIKGELQRCGCDLEVALPDITYISMLKPVPKLILIQAEDFLDKNKDILTYIRDYCVEHQSGLVILGYLNEIEEVKKNMYDSIIAGEYERPIDVRALCSNLMESFKVEVKKTSVQKTILVVDDSAVMLRTIFSWLEHKYKVVLANSGMTALQVIEKNKPDLILLDYEMPVCSGPQFMEMLRSEPKTAHIPIIFLTSKSDAESVKRVLSLKPEGYMLKTTPSAKVVDTIDKFFSDRAQKENGKS